MTPDKDKAGKEPASDGKFPSFTYLLSCIRAFEPESACDCLPEKPTSVELRRDVTLVAVAATDQADKPGDEVTSKFEFPGCPSFTHSPN